MPCTHDVAAGLASKKRRERTRKWKELTEKMGEMRIGKAEAVRLMRVSLLFVTSEIEEYVAGDDLGVGWLSGIKKIAGLLTTKRSWMLVSETEDILKIIDRAMGWCNRYERKTGKSALCIIEALTCMADDLSGMGSHEVVLRIVAGAVLEAPLDAGAAVLESGKELRAMRSDPSTGRYRIEALRGRISSMLGKGLSKNPSGSLSLLKIFVDNGYFAEFIDLALHTIRSIAEASLEGAHKALSYLGTRPLENFGKLLGGPSRNSGIMYAKLVVLHLFYSQKSLLPQLFCDLVDAANAVRKEPANEEMATYFAPSEYTRILEILASIAYLTGMPLAHIEEKTRWAIHLFQAIKYRAADPALIELSSRSRSFEGALYFLVASRILGHKKTVLEYPCDKPRTLLFDYLVSNSLVQPASSDHWKRKLSENITSNAIGHYVLACLSGGGLEELRAAVSAKSMSEKAFLILLNQSMLITRRVRLPQDWIDSIDHGEVLGHKEGLELLDPFCPSDAVVDALAGLFTDTIYHRPWRLFSEGALLELSAREPKPQDLADIITKDVVVLGAAIVERILPAADSSTLEAVISLSVQVVEGALTASDTERGSALALLSSVHEFMDSRSASLSGKALHVRDDLRKYLAGKGIRIKRSAKMEATDLAQQLGIWKQTLSLEDGITATRLFISEASEQASKDADLVEALNRKLLYFEILDKSVEEAECGGMYKEVIERVFAARLMDMDTIRFGISPFQIQSKLTPKNPAYLLALKYEVVYERLEIGRGLRIKIKEKAPAPGGVEKESLFMDLLFFATTSIGPEKRIYFGVLEKAYAECWAPDGADKIKRSLELALEYLWAYDVGMYRRFLGLYQKKHSSTAKLCSFRIGPLHSLYGALALMKYQSRFFVSHYHFTSLPSLVDKYLRELIAIKDLALLRYLGKCSTDALDESGCIRAIAGLPCKSSRLFLDVFLSYHNYSKAGSSGCPLKSDRSHPYFDMIDFYARDRSKRLGTGDARKHAYNYKITEYMSRFATDVNDVRKGVALEECNIEALPPIEGFLRARETLLTWERETEKAEQVSFIVGNASLGTSERGEPIINFAAEEEVNAKYKFICSVSQAAPRRHSSEREEILYILTRPDLAGAVDAFRNHRALSDEGASLLIQMIESIWVGAPSETYLEKACASVPAWRGGSKTLNEVLFASANQSRAKNAQTAEIFEMVTVPDLLEKSSLVMRLLLEKAKLMHEQGGGARARDTRMLLEREARSALQALQGTGRGALLGKAEDLEREALSVLAECFVLKCRHDVEEFESKPADVLKHAIIPALHAHSFGQMYLHVIKALSQLCLRIFERYNEEFKERKLDAPSADGKLGATDKMLLREIATTSEIEGRKRKEVSEVERLSYGLGIQMCMRLAEEDDDRENIINLVHLLFNETKDEYAHYIEKVDLSTIPSHRFIDVKYQVISKYFSGLGESRRMLQGILERLIGEHTCHVIYEVLAHEERCPGDGGADPFVSLFRGREEARAGAKMAIKEYKGILKDTLERRAGEFDEIVFPLGVPVATACIPVKESLDYTDAPCILKIRAKRKVLGGINSPVLIEVLGSNGRIYPEILKRNDELKQDMVSLQILDHMNRVVDKSRGCRKIKERIRTYKVVGFERFFGVIEYLRDADSLGHVIEATHSKLFPSEPTSRECREEMNKAVGLGREERVRCFLQVCDSYSPCLGAAIEGCGPYEYFDRKRSFTHSFALSAIATYVLGLGDRHCHNILLDKKTKELINIDLNLIFDQAALLRISERVPFRLTRNILQVLFTSGEFQFNAQMEAIFHALKQKKESLLVLISMFRHDPIHRWAILSRAGMSPEGAFSDYASILKRFREKLDGVEDGFWVSNRAHVRYLIQKATDVGNLATIFPGWQPWM